MAWLPILILTVFGMVSIAFMVQVPKEKPVHNIKRVIRGNPEPADVVEPVKVVETNVFRDIPGSGFEQTYNLMKNKNTALCANTHILKGENSKEPDVHICLDNIRPPCVVYSFGIAYNWIFDDFMIDQGCHVFSFDPSMTLGKHKRHKNHLFEPIGIGPTSGTHTGKSTLYGGKTNYEVLSLQDMMKRYDHSHIEMIRMDVESAEWNVLQQWTHDNLWQHIDQLLLEIHMYGDQYMHAETLMSIPMDLFHTARNLWNNRKLFKDMTQVYEVGFKKKSIKRKSRWLDVFHVNHEEAVWRLRFEEHWDYIDEFHVFESSVSHQGNPKNLFFAESGMLNSKYAEKIVYHKIIPLQNLEKCKIKGNWECETHDRMFIGKEMKSVLNNDDILFFSDADEIMSSSTFEKLRSDTSILPIRIGTPVFKHSFHWWQEDSWYKAVLVYGKHALKFNDWNDLRRKNNFNKYPKGGWHPSTFGSIDDIMNKGKMSRTARLFGREETERRVRNGIALYDTKRHFTYQENVDPLPKLASVDPEYFKMKFMRYGKQNKLKNFVNPFSGGGMSKDEQDFLEKTYRHSTSIFEWGMGSSSALANHLGVEKLVSVDNFLEWVEKTKLTINNDRYTFHYVNIGRVGAWGRPVDKQNIKWLDYSTKINDEKESFDVYLVDGRFRVACACLALLHSNDNSYIMIHDFERDYYQEILQVSEKIHQVGKLVQLKKKPGSNSMIPYMWEKYKYDYR